MNKKLLWKIEELWRKYSINICHSELDSESHSELSLRETKQSKLLFEKLYKNNTSIHNSDFHVVKNFNFEKSDNFVHKDDNSQYYGLKNSQVAEIKGKLVYLFDNHNKILHPFLEYVTLTRGSLASSCGFDVVHIDAHNDDAVFVEHACQIDRKKPQKLELKNIQEYIHQTRISDFFDFLSESNFIEKIDRYIKSNDFEEFKKPKNPYILSLDIDIFGPEGDFTELESKVKIIAQAWQSADVVCIAMSPGFIDQNCAQKIIEILTKREIK